MTEQFPELVKDTNAQIQEASKSQAWKSCLNQQPDEKGATGYNWELPSQPQQAKLHKASHQESVLSIHWKDWCWSWSSSTLSRLITKDPAAGKDWGQEEKGVTEDEMVEWHHWLNGDEFEQTPGDSEGQGSLVCCSLWGRKESDTT